MAGRAKRLVKSFFDVQSWLHLGELKNQWAYLKTLWQSLFTLPAERIDNADTRKNFQIALELNNLQEVDIARRVAEFRRLVAIFVVAGMGVWAYAIHLFVNHAFLSGILCLCIGAVMFAQGFRYHFWLFQIHERRLGCTFKDWLNRGFLGGKRT